MLPDTQTDENTSFPSEATVKPMPGARNGQSLDSAVESNKTDFRNPWISITFQD